MWKKTLLVLCIANSAWARTEVQTTLEELKQQWQAEQQQTEKQLRQQRENFIQLESLLNAAEKQGNVSDHLLQLAEKLQDPTYPLFDELQWALLKAKLTTEAAKNPAVLTQWIDDFTAKFPEIAKRNQLPQRLFPALYDAQQFSELVEYAKQHKPDQSNQCRLFSAKFQLLAEQLQPNPEAEQAVGSSKNFATLQTLLTEFEPFWLQTDKLSSECNGIEAYWRDQSLKTADKVQLKAVHLFQQKSQKGLESLSLNALGDLANWLKTVQHLLASPQNLQHFAENQPLAAHNKAILLAAFPAMVKTLPEQLENPDFSRYQQWAERWQLSEAEQREWKIVFLNRLFDNADPIFQLWRDEQITQLKADNLTERRLRLAIWQQTDLKPWLALLSDETKNKQEWRYWQAKADPTQRLTILKTLASERGFYPMLAANRLKQRYLPTLPKTQPLSDLQKNQLNRSLAKVAELRNLARFGSAKLAWIELLQRVDFNEKVALAEYAITQEWFDLAVEATIQAKAWDYLPLRLPNAYAEWFKANLTNSTIQPSFAMAIARQESAWNPQARSHANAIGLMQMLPTTAQATAKNRSLPYQQERDLLSPFKNIMLGTAHLDELNEKYPNNRILIAAAYNAGPHRVERWLARANNKLEMDEFIASIPFYETRGYVQNVLAYDFYYQMLYGTKPPMLFSLEEQQRY